MFIFIFPCLCTVYLYVLYKFFYGYAECTVPFLLLMGGGGGVLGELPAIDISVSTHRNSQSLAPVFLRIETDDINHMHKTA